MKRLALAICQNHIMSLTAWWLAFEQMEKPEDLEIIFCHGSASTKAGSLNDAYKQARESQCDYFLQIDMDTTPPRNVIRRLMGHNLPVVSGLSHLKTPPFSPLAGWVNAEGKHVNRKALPWKSCYAKLGDGLVEVDWVGVGCLWMEMVVLNEYVQKTGRMPFRDIWKDEDGTRAYGHDMEICRELKKLGYKIYVDTGCNCAHIGTIQVESILVECWQEARMTERMAIKLREMTTRREYWETIWGGEALATTRRIYPEDFDWIVNKVAEGAHVADIGCGCGYLLKRLQSEKKCDVYGYDISQTAIEGLKQNGMDGETADLRDFKCNGRSFDYLVCTHTLEHFADTKPVLLAMRELVKPDGIVIVTVAKDDSCVEHFKNYTERDNLQGEFKEAGFVVIENFETTHSFVAVLKVKEGEENGINDE